jgi:PTH1 family peptidyl-tRNA hydrolase
MVGHVLGRFTGQEMAAVADVVHRAVDALLLALRSGLEAAMNLYNRKETANVKPHKLQP